MRAHYLLTALLVVSTAFAAEKPATHEAGGPPKLDPRMPALFTAVGEGKSAGVRAALASGVSPDARNFLGITPLMFAAATGNVEAAQELLRAGAMVDAPSPFGSALTFAIAEGHPKMAELILDKGVTPEPGRIDGITPLMLAAGQGETEIERRLLEHGAKVEKKNENGATALTYAARFGKAETARLLLEHGAQLEAADNRKWTPLMYAAANGHLTVVDLLLQKGAHSRGKDAQGRTPLLLAVSYSCDPAVVKTLLEHGASATEADKQGRTPAEMATIRTEKEALRLLREHGAKGGVTLLNYPRLPRTAAEAGLRQIQHSVGVFNEKLGCVSCHHQGMALFTTGLAKDYGYAIDTALMQKQMTMIRGQNGQAAPLYNQALVHPELAAQVPFAEISEAVPGDSFNLAGLAAQHPSVEPIDTTSAILLGRRQSEDGRWGFHLQRAPMQSSDCTTTAFTIQALQSLAAKKYPDEVRSRTAKAKQWLLTTQCASNEDQSFRVLGLVWAGATPEELKAPVAELMKAQQADGGWSQLAGMKTDAYATGEALVALKLSGAVKVNSKEYQRGVQFLLRQQDDDGSWYVHKRAAPLNFFTDVDFPHGESQYTSFAGTCWATMALILSSGKG